MKIIEDQFDLNNGRYSLWDDDDRTLLAEIWFHEFDRSPTRRQVAREVLALARERLPGLQQPTLKDLLTPWPEDRIEEGHYVQHCVYGKETPEAAREPVYRCWGKGDHDAAAQ